MLIGELAFVLLLGLAFGWLKSGNSSMLGLKSEAILYWVGALLLVWVSFYVTTMLVAYLLKSINLPNIVFMLLGAIVGLFPGRSLFYAYMNWMGVDREMPPLEFANLIELLSLVAGHIYASGIFIILWLVSSFISWSRITNHRPSTTNRARDFLFSQGYWLFKSISQDERNEGTLDDAELPLQKTDIARNRVLALKAEDHYVKVIHQDGELLIHARLKDAIVDVERSVSGVRVHRSWWVSKINVVEKSRGQLTWVRLQGGLKVPVSRSYAIGAQKAFST